MLKKATKGAALIEPDRVAIEDIHTEQISTASDTWRTRKRRPRNFAIVFGTVVTLALVALSHYTVVWTDGGPLVLAKDHFTLAETFVSLNSFNEAGTVAAQQRWPMTFSALQRAGILSIRPKISREYARPPGGKSGIPKAEGTMPEPSRR